MRKSLLLIHFYIRKVCTYLFIGLLTVLSHLPATADQPTIGLVLSGGGARGAAHIGVLKYLEANNIPVDIITGTSFGAIVGGLYASGMSAAEIEEAMLGMDWERALTDDVSRADRGLQRKRREDIFSIPGSPGVREGELVLPSGAIQGQNVILALQALTAHVASVRDFDQLPIRFRALATDIVNGEAVILKEGELALALRASMGVPAVFSPIEIDGRLLVDGGVTNNLPIDVAKWMGADVVIAVDITSPMLPRDEVSNLLTITDQLTRLLVVNNTSAQRLRLRGDDVLIIPELSSVSAVDFNNPGPAIELGLKAAEYNAEALARLASDEPVERTPAPDLELERLAEVRIDNRSRLDDTVIIEHMTSRVGDPANLDVIADDMNRIHGIGQFELVSYELDRSEQGEILTVTAQEKRWGPNYLHFGLSLDSEFRHDSRFSFLVGYSKQALNATGAEWLSWASFGDEPQLMTSLHWPSQRFRSVFGYAEAGYKDEALYDYSNNTRSSVYALRNMSARVGLGYSYNENWHVTLGLTLLSGRAHAVSGADTISNTEMEEGGIDLRFVFDTRDDIDFPSKGTVVDASWNHYLGTFGSEKAFRQWRIHAGKYFDYQQHNLGLNLHVGGTEGIPTLNTEFKIGGYGMLSGLSTHERRGRYMGVLSAVYYQRFEPLPILDGLIGVTLEYGGAWEERDDISDDQSTVSGGAFVGADTPIGTLQLGFGVAEGGQRNYYTRIGRVF